MRTPIPASAVQSSGSRMRQGSGGRTSSPAGARLGAGLARGRARRRTPALSVRRSAPAKARAASCRSATPRRCRRRDQRHRRPARPCRTDPRRAGWRVPSTLVTPDDITLLPLPPRSPELDPVENVAVHAPTTRSRTASSQATTTSFAHCCAAWNDLIDQPWRIRSIGRRTWAGRVLIDLTHRIASSNRLRLLVALASAPSSGRQSVFSSGWQAS